MELQWRYEGGRNGEVQRPLASGGVGFATLGNYFWVETDSDTLGHRFESFKIVIAFSLFAFLSVLMLYFKTSSIVSRVFIAQVIEMHIPHSPMLKLCKRTFFNSFWCGITYTQGSTHLLMIQFDELVHVLYSCTHNTEFFQPLENLSLFLPLSNDPTKDD